MTIEMPPFHKIYKQREGADKFFYDKLHEVADAVNALTSSETATVSVSVLDDEDEGVEGAKVTLTSGNDEYSTGDTGKAGGASIQNVPYGVYTVGLTIPEGYTKLANYENVTVNSSSVKVTLKVNKVS